MSDPRDDRLRAAPSTLAFGADSTLPVTQIQVAEQEEAA